MRQLPSRLASQTRARTVRFALRDGDWVDGGVYLTEGHALAPYIGSRKGGWMNIVGATWASEGIAHGHAVIQVDEVLWAVARDRDLRIGAVGAGNNSREVDILLEDGTRLHGRINLAARQRLSDYLSSCGRFIPVVDAARPHGGECFGDIALNARCVRAVRDGRVLMQGTELADGRADWGGLRRSPSAVIPAVHPDEIEPEFAESP